MESINTATLINILGFSVGIALYSLLLVMVIRHRGGSKKVEILLVVTAILGFLWNFGEFLSFVWRDFVGSSISPLLVAVSYSALGFLPSVVVHSAENEKRNSRILTVSAYCLSFFAAILHFQSAAQNGSAPATFALQIQTIGSILLVCGLLFFNYKEKLENKTVWIAALLVFAVSALHLGEANESSSWFVEMIAHQSSLPLVLAILIQDYRFAFADIFLKRALSLLLLALTAFGLYVFVAAPLSSLHFSHEENDAVAIGILLVLWIATALIYPFLHKFSVWFVDKVILRRINYELLQTEISIALEKQQNIDLVLDEVSRKLKGVLTADSSSWNEVRDSSFESKLPDVQFNRENIAISVPTNEAPFYEFRIRNFIGGRKLLSEEAEMLEAVSLLTARRIDALRVLDERFERETQEKEYAKLTAEAQLTALRSQINPHFLFNALTTIGYLIRAAPERAFETLMKLTQLLRSVLKSDGEFCSLDEELNLIGNYLDIEKARFEERLTIEIDVSEELRRLRIPSLILQPLVENAVKHAISENKGGGTVKISAKLENNDAQAFLKLYVSDSGAGKPRNEVNNSNGIGLENVKGRLKSYYGEKAGFSFEKDPISGSVVRLTIPVKMSQVV